MKPKTRFTKKDVLVGFCCAIFLLAGLGAVGGRGRRRAKEVVCAANLKRWGVIFHTFAEDHGGLFMNRAGAMTWTETFQPYYIHRKLLLCPEARRTYWEGGRNPFMAWVAGDGQSKCSYVINLWISNSTSPNYWRTPFVAKGAQAPILLDGQAGNMQPYPEDEPPAHEDDMWTPGPLNEMRRACVSRHNGAVNAIFLDGSVRKVGLKYLWRLGWHREWPDDFPLPAWPEWMQNFKDPE